jgi:sulfur carrier protein ThiS
MSPSTQGSPKVPEQPWPKALYARKGPDWVRPPRLSTVNGGAANEPSLEEETYIPVSALLSDEAIEAVAVLFNAEINPTANWADLVAEENGCVDVIRVKARKYLQAAIEHVGGGQGGE